MAFTEAEKNQISTILGVIPIELTAWLNFNAPNITAQVETDVRTQLTRWTTAGVDFVTILKTESNYGVQLDAEDTKDDIRKNIALLLGLDSSAYLGGSGARLQRS